MTNRHPLDIGPEPDSHGYTHDPAGSASPAAVGSVNDADRGDEHPPGYPAPKGDHDSPSGGKSRTCAADRPDFHTTPEMLASGATRRQLEYWQRLGWLKTHPEWPGGSGAPRLYARGELGIARRMVALCRAGFTPRAAAELARVRVLLEVDGLAVVNLRDLPEEGAP